MGGQAGACEGYGNMAKNASSSKQDLPPAAREALREAREALADGDVGLARDLLIDLDHRHPRRREILSPLVDACLGLTAYAEALRVAEEWCEQDPQAAGANYARIKTYIAQDYPLLTAQACQAFLEMFPGDERAAPVEQVAQAARDQLQAVLPHFSPDPAVARVLAEENERVRRAIDLARFAEAHERVTALLERFPDFLPAHNNRALLEMRSGDLARAIQTLESVLDRQSDNVHALANLVRCRVMSGEQAAAEQVAQRLRGAEPTPTEGTLKRLEAFGFLGDDLEVLRLVRGLGADADIFALFLGGVSAWRLVHIDEARRFWERALDLDPDHEPSLTALDDLDEAVGDQIGPQAFDLRDWVPEPVARDLEQTLRPNAKANVAALTRQVQAFVERHRFLERVAPTLLERGGQDGRDFIFSLAASAQTPALLAAVRDHALSQLGSDDFRISAAQLVVEHGLLPAGPTRLWIQGAWQPVLLLNIELVNERPPGARHGRSVTKWLKESILASRRGDLAEAERLIRLALQTEPDAPDLHNNLATVMVKTGRHAEAEQVLREVLKRHGDYGFARANLASQLVEQGDLDAAREMLAPLMARRQMHQLEFAALCAVQVKIAFAADDDVAARQWLAIWEEARPDDPALAVLRAP